MVYNQYDLQNTSLVKTGILTEMYIPLWWYSNSYFNSNNLGNTPSAPSSMLGKGSNAIFSYGGGSQVKLHTLSPNWSSSQKFAIEVSAYSNGGAACGYVSLYDFITGNTVSASQMSVSTTTATVLRSSQFTLIPGHTYGVCAWSSNSSYYIYLNKASLIAFLS